jgi:hypothetical protein
MCRSKSTQTHCNRFFEVSRKLPTRAQRGTCKNRNWQKLASSYRPQRRTASSQSNTASYNTLTLTIAHNSLRVCASPSTFLQKTHMPPAVKSRLSSLLGSRMWEPCSVLPQEIGENFCSFPFSFVPERERGIALTSNRMLKQRSPNSNSGSGERRSPGLILEESKTPPSDTKPTESPKSDPKALNKLRLDVERFVLCPCAFARAHRATERNAKPK